MSNAGPVSLVSRRIHPGRERRIRQPPQAAVFQDGGRSADELDTELRHVTNLVGVFEISEPPGQRR
ncbi:MAG: hypothetical protein WB761_00825 [Solirubrobacteraceae bacterium]